MSSRKPIRRDPVDLAIAGLLKAWVERVPEPQNGRDALLQVAAAEIGQSLLGRVIGAALRGLLLALSGISDALMGEPVFETWDRDPRVFAPELASFNMSLIHISFFYSHTPRLGLFSMLL